MIDQVDYTLQLWRSSAFEYGETDCMLSVGDYLARCGVVDVTKRFRGTYSDEAGALAHMAAVGGVAALINLTGLPRTSSPVRGDVVCLDTGDFEVGGLCTGRDVAVRLERGIVEIDMRFVRVTHSWKVPQCPVC